MASKTPDDDILEAISALFEAAEGQPPSSEEDFELLSDGESIEVLEAASEGLEEDSAAAAVKDDQLDEGDEILRALVKLFKTAPVAIEEDTILEALNELFFCEEEPVVVVEDARETNGSANVQKEKSPIKLKEVETFRQLPTGGIRFESSNGLEFIALGPALPLKVSQLKCAARIFHDGMELRLHNEGCLFLIDDTFIARVELMHALPVQNSTSFAQAKSALFRQLCIGQILVDHVVTTRDHQRAELRATINRIREATDPTDALQLFTIVQRAVNLNYMDFCELLYCSKATPRILMEHAVKLLQIEQATERRNRFLRQLHARFTNSSHELRSTLTEFCAKVVENRATSLLDMAPHCLREQLKDIPQRNVFRMHDNDVKVFHDLDKVLNKEIFQKPLDDLAKRWINRVKLFKTSDAIVSVVNPIYFSLCRSLEELIVEIAGKTEHNPEELLLSDHSGWHALKTAIKWKKETSLTKCLQREYFFIVRLLKHFDPASGNTKPFEYKLRRLLGGAAKESMLGSFFRRLIGQTQQNPLRIPDVFYVWFCLLDDVLHHVLPEDDQSLEIFEQILQNFIQLLSKATFEQMEMIRVITHSVGRFIVQIFLFVSSDKAQSYEDKQILQLQQGAINRTMQGSESTKFFRDLIEVFSSYWKNRCDIIENIPLKCGLSEMEQIKKTLLAIVVVALRKNIDAGQVIDLFRVLNDFIVDLDDVSFDWIVKSLPEKEKQDALVLLKLIEPFDNKWSGTENEVYRVVQPVKFQQLQHVLLEGEPGPKHCIIEVVSTLLSFIHTQLERTHWTSQEHLSESDQILSSSALVSSIRSTLIYLREQAEYVSFDMFLEERIDPFCKVLENSSSSSDFVKRVGMIKESFCYMRKQNEISVTEALRMYGEFNDERDYSAELLQEAYQQYSDQFEAYMAEAVPEEDEKGKVGVVCKLLMESVRPILFKEWTAEFKQKELPKILAGVAAVWSILVSADVSSTGKYFKPHCIQVLCVLRLLGVDNGEKGVLKQLAQVLTGQGKSLVLALIASVLALTGHQVQLVCYNDYLVKRDAKDFAGLFDILEIANVIKYDTYEGMANAVVEPEVNGKQMGLRSFVNDLILSKPTKLRPKKPKAQVQDNSVLLMDEVDVFFTKDFYGCSLYPAATPFIFGLDIIQEQIWNLVTSQGKRCVHEVTAEIGTFIESPSFMRRAYFNKFLDKETLYELVVYQRNWVKKQFTNKALFCNQLKLMIEDAIYVTTSKWEHSHFRLNDKGVITYKDNGRFVTNCIPRYRSVFNYFRLKRHNFQVRVGSEHNYGYLNISCGSLSYAMLPKAYPLIVGVTGTLTSLNQYEKAAIDRLYNINRTSIMPSFFGCSNLQFNPEQNFTYLTTKPIWMSRIFARAHAVVTANRAAIVFFYDDSLLEEFRAQYCGQFDRLQILTENTEEDKHEHLISEAGVARTVTLATRGMGRGVDYKSSVAVEKNGGVHVIQSFFSLDVKEETQIRGRTARKDNKGSYELIVFEGHLKTQKLIEEGKEVTYEVLNAARMEIALKENKDIEESIEKNKVNHLTTLAYLQSFFE